MMEGSYLAKVSCAVSIDEFFGVHHVQVHVGVGGNEESLVFVSPLELDHHGFPNERVEEGFRVHGHLGHIEA